MAEPAVSFSVMPCTTRLSIRAGADAVAAIGRGLGVVLGTEPCRANRSGDCVALWLGPDEWLLLGPDDVAVVAPSATAPVSIVDVSHRTVAIELRGARAADVLNAFCALDLNPRAFPVGCCTRTVFGKTEIVLWRTAAETFRLEIARSFVPYVQGCLAEAAREFVG